MKNIFRQARKYGGWIAVISVIFIANPTGFSYFHAAKKFDWGVTVSTGLMAGLGLLLIGSTLYYVSGGWDSLDKLGKLLFISFTGICVFMLYAAGLLKSIDAYSWLAIVIVICFNFWGMLWPRMTWGTHKNRQVTGTGNNSDDDNNDDDGE